MKTTVKSIARKGNSVLVEYIQEGLTVRKVLAHRHIIEDQVSSVDLEQAAPYGVPVRDLAESSLNMELFPSRLEIACRSRGLWTKDDFAKNPTLVMSALQEALRFDTAQLINLVLTSDD